MVPGSRLVDFREFSVETEPNLHLEKSWVTLRDVSEA